MRDSYKGVPTEMRRNGMRKLPSKEGECCDVRNAHEIDHNRGWGGGCKCKFHPKGSIINCNARAYCEPMNLQIKVQYASTEMLTHVSNVVECNSILPKVNRIVIRPDYGIDGSKIFQLVGYQK